MERPQSKPSETERALMRQQQRDEYAANKARVIQHMKKRGLRPEAIAGLVANIQHETGGSFDFQQKQTKTGSPTDPRTIEHGGYGLFQFDNFKKNVGHRSWYQSYLKDNEKEDSPESQIDYVLDTIFADTQDPNYKFKKLTGVGDMGTLKAYLETNTSPSTIAAEFESYFEKAKVPHSDRRKKIANDIFSELAPPDRADIGPEDQFINQAGEIRDTGEVGDDQLSIVDVPEEKSMYEKVKPYIPVLRHLNEGGMALEKQMELFEDGGLKEEGGTIDPVSGNDVPPGSTKEEVRDDIPAQLSEGEFVFPADVVRYIGLEKLMQMRQEAKQGLQTMERMGQMGNSEDATMSDDIPFDLSDLDMSDDLEYNVGGFVPGVQQDQQFTGIAGYRPPQMQQTGMGYVPAPMPQYQSPQMPGVYQPPQQAAVPVMQPPTTMPQFGQFTEQNVETREYINPATGERRIFTFIGGQPTVAIPEGFIPSSEYTAPETPKPADVAVETTSVVSPDSDERDERYAQRQEEEFGPGGGRLGIAGQTFGVSFEPAGEGLPGLLGALGTIGKAVAGNLPDDTIVNLKNATGSFSVSGSQYNNLKAIIKGEGANSPTAEMYLKDIQQDYKDNIANVANTYKLDSSGKSSTQILEEASEASGQDVDDLIRGAKARRDLEKHNAEVDRKAADKRRQEEKAAAVRQRQEDEIRQQAEAIRQANEAAAAKAAATRQRDEADREDRQRERDNRQAIDRANEAMGRDRGFRGFDDGGLAKKKPKTKKMKRGGLASKKQFAYMLATLIPHPTWLRLAPTRRK